MLIGFPAVGAREEFSNRQPPSPDTLAINYDDASWEILRRDGHENPADAFQTLSVAVITAAQQNETWPVDAKKC